MSIFQLIMLGTSAYFAFKIYEHVQTLQEPDINNDDSPTTLIKGSVDELFKEADKLRENGDYERALAVYSDVKMLEPQNAEVLFKMGYTMSQLQRYDEALEYFQDSLKYDDENPFTYLEISKIYTEMEDEENAKIYHERWTKLDEDLRNL